MSFKVYNAFKVVRPSDVWEMLKLIQVQGELNVRNRLRSKYLKMVQEMDPDSEEYKTTTRNPQRHEAHFRLVVARDIVRKGYKKATTSPYHDEFNLDVNVALYPHKGQFYLRTFCDCTGVARGSLDFVSKLPGLVDYHYQNSTDRPDDVSAREWRKRRRIWDEITLPFNSVGHHLTLEVMSMDKFYQIDPWLDLYKEWSDRPPTIPTREEFWAGYIGKLKAVTSVTCRKGHIRVMPGNATVTAKGTVWQTTIKGVKKEHPSLNAAADSVYFEYLPQDAKDMIENLRARCNS